MVNGGFRFPGGNQSEYGPGKNGRGKSLDVREVPFYHTLDRPLSRSDVEGAFPFVFASVGKGIWGLGLQSIGLSVRVQHVLQGSVYFVERLKRTIWGFGFSPFL